MRYTTVSSTQGIQEIDNSRRNKGRAFNEKYGDLYAALAAMGTSECIKLELDSAKEVKRINASLRSWIDRRGLVGKFGIFTKSHDNEYRIWVVRKDGISPNKARNAPREIGEYTEIG